MSLKRTFGVGLVVLSCAFAAADNLEIYFVDVEGGAATLVVSPSGESMLVDTGNPGNDDRDASRIYAAALAAGLRKIDYLLTTHYHGDHIGALQPLLKRLPIEKFFDHGPIAQSPTGLYQTYLEIARNRGRHSDRATRSPGAKVQVASSDGQWITRPINGGGPNEAYCRGAEKKGPGPGS